jgi:hypothetical protein
VDTSPPWVAAVPDHAVSLAVQVAVNVVEHDFNGVRICELAIDDIDVAADLIAGQAHPAPGHPGHADVAADRAVLVRRVGGRPEQREDALRVAGEAAPTAALDHVVPDRRVVDDHAERVGDDAAAHARRAVERRIVLIRVVETAEA